LAELRRLLPGAEIEFDPGMNPAESALMAARCAVALVFAVKLDSEGLDDPDLSLPWGQDAVIEAVAAANPNTIVVLERGNPVVMPWRDRVRAIVEAWYPGQAGGQAIARDPDRRSEPVRAAAGHLPGRPRPDLPGLGTPWGTPVIIEYTEGAEVGYRWFARQHHQPLYAFAHGLSYATFDYSNLQVQGGDTITAAFTVTNTGGRAGADVPQLYLTAAAGAERLRLLGFQRVELQPGESRQVIITADRRLLARFDGPDGITGNWRIAEGTYRIAVGRSAHDLVLTADTPLRGS
jgi:beta-glucosidase